MKCKLSATKEKCQTDGTNATASYFDEIRDSDEFHHGHNSQPKWVQDALYENDNDARSAARAIDLYKADMGIGKKKQSQTKTAAKSVSIKVAIAVVNRKKNEEASYLKESDVQRMSAQEYENRSDEIMEAIRSGKFIYDVSGSMPDKKVLTNSYFYI